MFIDIFDAMVLDECLEDNLPSFSVWELVTSHNLVPSGAKPRGPSSMSEYISGMG